MRPHKRHAKKLKERLCKQVQLTGECMALGGQTIPCNRNTHRTQTQSTQRPASDQETSIKQCWLDYVGRIYLILHNLASNKDYVR